jgi:hypothetical protein
MKRKTNGKTVPAHGISKTFTVEPLLVSGFFFLVSLHLPTASRHSSSTLDNMKKTIVNEIMNIGNASLINSILYFLFH